MSTKILRVKSLVELSNISKIKEKEEKPKEVDRKLIGLVFEVLTDSVNTSFTLPLISNGTYNFVVDWGDNTKSNIVDYSDDQKTHVYSEPDLYTVKIRGIIDGWQFNDNADSEKIYDLKNWGNLRLKANGYHFKGCSNLTISATDVPKLDNTFSLKETFYNCVSLTKIPKVSKWRTGNITSFESMFSNTQFNDDISTWKFGSAENLDYFLNNTELSEEIYNKFILNIGNSVPNNLELNMGNSKFTPTNTIIKERLRLSEEFNFTFNDHGVDETQHSVIQPVDDIISANTTINEDTFTKGPVSISDGILLDINEGVVWTVYI